MPNIATLPLLLKQLSLPSMYAHWESHAVQAEQSHWSYPEYLTSLSNQEVMSRAQKRIARHIKEAKLPPGKTLSVFDFKAAKSVNAAQITALADNTSWVKQAHNLVIFGPSGVGKSHLACSIAHRLVEQGVRALFMSTTVLVQKLQQAREAYRLPEAIAKLARILLISLLANGIRYSLIIICRWLRLIDWSIMQLLLISKTIVTANPLIKQPTEDTKR
jgi:DNA replication protein DnaC